MKSLAPEIKLCSQGICATKLWYLAGCPKPLFRENEPWKECRNLKILLYRVLSKSLFHLGTWAQRPSGCTSTSVLISHRQESLLPPSQLPDVHIYKAVLKLKPFIRLSALSTLPYFLAFYSVFQVDFSSDFQLWCWWYSCKHGKILQFLKKSLCIDFLLSGR